MPKNKKTNTGYKDFIEDNFQIVNKLSEVIPFTLNKIQTRYILDDSTNKDCVLKARQQGISSIILALFATDFLLKEHSRSVIVADISGNATELLDRVKFFIGSYEDKNKIKVPLKYNSKYELFNQANNSRYTIGTADNVNFGRSKTMTNLHLSEYAFYNKPHKLLAGALQALVPDGRAIIETTANGFNEFKTFWDKSKNDETGFKAIFYDNSFYDKEFLEEKKKELGDLFPQEYPVNDIEAFLSSGNPFFNREAMRIYLKETKEPIKTMESYYDLSL